MLGPASHAAAPALQRASLPPPGPLRPLSPKARGQGEQPALAPSPTAPPWQKRGAGEDRSGPPADTGKHEISLNFDLLFLISVFYGLQGASLRPHFRIYCGQNPGTGRQAERQTSSSPLPSLRALRPPPLTRPPQGQGQLWLQALQAKQGRGGRGGSWARVTASNRPPPTWEPWAAPRLVQLSCRRHPG